MGAANGPSLCAARWYSVRIPSWHILLIDIDFLFMIGKSATDPKPDLSSPATRRQPSNTQAGLTAAAEVLRDSATRWWRPWAARREREHGLVRAVLGAVADVPAASLQPLIGPSSTLSRSFFVFVSLTDAPMNVQ